jgi:hypothetical protein
MNNSETNLSPLQNLMNTNNNLIVGIDSQSMNIAPQNVTAKVNFLYKQVLIVLQQFVTTFLDFMNKYINITQKHEKQLAAQDRKFVTLLNQIDEYDKKVTEFTTLMNKVLAERQPNTPMREETRYSMYSGGNKTRKQRKYKRKISK